MRTRLVAALLTLSAACDSESEGPVAPVDGGADAAPADQGDAADAPVDAGDDAPSDGASDAAAPTDAGSGEAFPPPPRDGGQRRYDASVPRPVDPQQISWKPCADNTRDCGSMHVPLDYARPEAGMVKLAVMRRRASAARLGALLLNPGGPGSSAVDYLGIFVEGSTSPLLDHFDLVAFDPRGVGYSTRIDCHATLQQWIAADPSPDDEAEWQAIDDAAARFAADCQQAHADLLPHLGTLEVARDMERVRAALGESKLNYLGFSYGASIGARYAELFPSNVGAMVLDAPVDLGLPALDLTLQQAKGFELALSHYFAWCKAAPARCSWTNGAEPAQAFAALAAAVESQPIPAPGSDRALGPGELLTAVGATLYGGELGWNALSPGLAQALTGNADMLMSYVDGYLQREPDGSYPNREEANHAVNCLDRQGLTVAEIRAAQARFASEAPIFGLPALTGQLVCAHWAQRGQDRAPPRAPSAPPLVVIGTLADPATPYAWAQAMAGYLSSSVLLTASGDGHTGYNRGNLCIDEAVESYLFDGVVPMAMRCDPVQLRLSAPLSTTPAARFWRR